jgi:hypothetical protein
MKKFIVVAVCVAFLLSCETATYNTLKNNLETLEELNTLYEGLKRLYFS